jgi:uncharacterized protein YegP (UPF0339 family)
MAKARFVVRKGSTGKFRFNLIGTNGRIIATSEPYNSKASALKGIQAVKRHALDADVLDDATAPKPRGSRARERADAITSSTRRVRQDPGDGDGLGGPFPGGSQPL